MDEELNQAFWDKYTRPEWEDPRGAAVLAFVLARHKRGYVQLAEKACRAAGADFNAFATAAAAEIKRAEENDRKRGIKPPGQPAKTGLMDLKSIAPQSMKWLWTPYIPSASLCIIQGDPGSGKTFLASWLASIVTNGSETPDGQTMPQGSVIFQSMEDGLAEGLVPRLINAGCDMSRCKAFDESDKPLHVQDLARIEQAFKDTPDLRLFVIDPIQSYLGAKTDMNRANEVRGALKGLLNLCNQYNVALVMIGHTGKGERKDLHRLLGSIDFVAQARSVLTVGESQTTPGERIVIQTKCSNAQKGDPFAYHIDNQGAQFDGFRPGLTESDMKENEGSQTRVDEAISFTLGLLKDRPMTVKDMEGSGKQADLNSITLRRARERLKDENRVSLRKVGSRGAWYWHLKDKTVYEVGEMLVYIEK